MKDNKIPIKAAKKIAYDFDKDQVVIFCWSKKTGKQWITTYGKSKSDCIHAAKLGNAFKKTMGWPDELCHAKPPTWPIIIESEAKS